jgi:hypothetical protein
MLQQKGYFSLALCRVISLQGIFMLGVKYDAYKTNRFANVCGCLDINYHPHISIIALSVIGGH